MKISRITALALSVMMIFACVCVPGFAAAEDTAAAAAADYGTVIEDNTGAVTLNFGNDSITTSGGGSIITDSANGNVKRPDNLKTNKDGVAVLTLPEVDLSGKGYTKVDLYAASKNDAAVVVKVGDTEVASFDNVNNSSWDSYRVNTADLESTEAKGAVTLNITRDNAYCGNYVYVKFYNPDAKPALLPYQDESLSFEERAADLVSRMTLEEKVYQMGMMAPAIDRLGVASYNYWREGLHGVARQGKATSFPSPLSISNTWNRTLAFDMGDVTSTEARIKNSRTDLSYWSPTINMARDPRWGRNEETMGEDPYLTGQLAAQFVDGMQGDDEKYLKVIATLKHYAANNNENNRGGGSSVMTEFNMRNYYAKVFQNVTEQVMPASVMASYNGTTVYRNNELLYNFIPSMANKYLLNDLLRKNWGFDGYVTTDCGAGANLEGSSQFKQGILGDSSYDMDRYIAEAVKSGLNTECNLGDRSAPSNDNRTQSYGIAAVENGYITENEIERAVYELFLQRFRTGEFDSDVSYRNTNAADLESDANVAKAEAAAEESWVLLKNDDNVLPLDSNDKKIVVAGPRAAEVTLGDYSGTPTKNVTPIEGITAEVAAQYPGSTVQQVGVVENTTALMNIKSITLIDEKGGKTQVDLSKAEVIGGGSVTNGVITGITRVSKVQIPQINFGKAATITMEISTGSAPGGTVAVHYGEGGPEGAYIKSQDTASLDTYAECSGEYTGADGGYSGTELMELTFEANTPEITAERYKAEFDAADVIIAYAGTNTGDSSESHDRANIDLPASQAHVQSICDAYPDKTVVVMSTVGQINVEPFMDKCKAILWTSYNGQTQGTALGKVLTGQVNPSGKLTTTWYKNDDVKKMELYGGNKKIGDITGGYTDYNIQADGFSPGHTYQYYGGTPIYPFGYGLSYTNFEYSNMKVSGGEPAPDTNPYTITGAEYSGGKLNVTYTKKDGAPEATLIAAAYSDKDEKNMVETESVKIDGSGSQSIEIAEPQGGKTKVYIWENTDSIKPLSYTKTVGEADSGAPASGADANGALTFSVDVTNTGSAAGKEAVQLYVSHPNAGEGTTPAKQLKGFEKIELQPGETKTVSIELNIRDMYLFDEAAQKDIVPEGTYTAYMASSSADISNSAKFEVTGTLASTLKTVRANPDGVTVLGRVDENGNGHETVNSVNSNISIVMSDETVVDPSEADITYESADSEIASVSSSGVVVSGTKTGVTTITATVTYGGETKTASFPIVNELQIKASDADKTAAIAQLTEVRDSLPKTAYKAESWAEIEKIYADGVKAVNDAVTKDDIENIIPGVISGMKNITMDNLSETYTIESVNPQFIVDGVIDYREGGIPMYENGTGTVNEANPYTGELVAKDASGNKVDASKLTWQIKKVDPSSRKVADIDNDTGALTVYGNGIVQITAADIAAGTCGRLVVEVETQIEAETADDGGKANLKDAQNGASGGFDAGSTANEWMLYKSVNLEYIDSFIARVAGRNAGMIYVSLDKNSKAENLIASVQADATGGWAAWTEVSLDINPSVIDAAKASGKIDKDGRGDIYIQTNGVNLDYFRINHYVPNDDTPYIVGRALNKQDGDIKVKLTYRGSAAPTDAVLAVEVYGADGALKSTNTSTTVKGGGDYDVNGLKASDGDTLRIYVINNMSEKKHLSETAEHTYAEPVPSEIEIITLNKDYTNFDYSQLTSGTNADSTPLDTTVNGVSGFGSWKVVDSTAKYTYKDINETEYSYEFTQAWQAGVGNTTNRNFYFTPKKVPCKVSAVFQGSAADRSMKIWQSEDVNAEMPGGTGTAAASLEITEKLPVYIYGGSSNKQLYAIIVEYYGEAKAADAADEQDEEAEDFDRPVQYATWNGKDVTLTKNDRTGESKVWVELPEGMRLQLRTDTFYSSDVPYSYGDRYNINALAEYNGRLYAACDGGMVIMFTDCAKCYQLKKVADIDLKSMRIEDGVMIAGDGASEVRIPMSELGGDSIEPDEADVLLAGGAKLIDVRTAEEYSEDHAEGSVNIPIDELESGLEAYGKDETLIFCCASGGRAAKAVETAKALGYENVYNIGSYERLK